MSQPGQPWQGGPPAGPAGGWGGQPSGGPPGGWGQPAAGPPPPPQKKSNTWIWIVVAAVVLLVLSVPCAAIGIMFLAGGAAYTMAARPAALPEPAPSAAVVGSSAAPAAVSAAASDPRDAAFAAFVLDAARAIESTARGQPHDPRWDEPGMGDDLRRAQPDNAVALAPLGAWTVVVTSLEVEAIAASAGGTGYVRSSVLVFPDGRVRWLSMSARVQPTVFVRPTAGLELAAPALSGEVARMVEALGAPTCALPTASMAELATLPAALTRGANAAAEMPGACRTVANLGPTVWQPRFDDVTVVVTGNGRWVALRSGFDVSGGRVTLSSVRARPAP